MLFIDSYYWYILLVHQHLFYLFAKCEMSAGPYGLMFSNFLQLGWYPHEVSLLLMSPKWVIPSWRNVWV